jgi:hypothetical protein
MQTTWRLRFRNLWYRGQRFDRGTTGFEGVRRERISARDLLSMSTGKGIRSESNDFFGINTDDLHAMVGEVSLDKTVGQWQIEGKRQSKR